MQITNELILIRDSNVNGEGGDENRSIHCDQVNFSSQISVTASNGDPACHFWRFSH